MQHSTSRGILFITEDNQQKLVLLHRIKNGKEYYTFPGGHLEDGETPEQTLIREMKEELNINVTVHELLKEYDNIDLKRHEYFYLCEQIGGTLQQGNGPERDRNPDENFYEIVKIPVQKLADYNLLPMEIKELICGTIIGNTDKPNVVLLALHGGKIEPGTGEIVEALAGNKFAYYIFEGRLPDKNWKRLHTPSEQFENDELEKMVKKARLIFSFHGCSDKKSESIIIGGGQREVIKKFYAYSKIYEQQLGMTFTDKRIPGLSGENQKNPVNLSRFGIQLELPRSFRNTLRNNKEIMQTFIAMIEGFIAEYL